VCAACTWLMWKAFRSCCWWGRDDTTINWCLGFWYKQVSGRQRVLYISEFLLSSDQLLSPIWTRWRILFRRPDVYSAVKSSSIWNGVQARSRVINTDTSMQKTENWITYPSWNLITRIFSLFWSQNSGLYQELCHINQTCGFHLSLRY